MAFACNSMRHHHNKKVHEGVEFCCDICGKDFAFKKGLRRHIITVHEGKKDFECNKCDHKFTQKNNLKCHIEEVHENKRRLKNVNKDLQAKKS